MGKPPAAIVIARHGARLDAADENWHLTSPTPYDPPLTYGGWTQARTLGLRVAGLLQNPEWWDSTRSSGGGGINGAGDTMRRSNSRSGSVAGLSSVSEEAGQKYRNKHGSNYNDNSTPSGGQEEVKPRKYRVIIHSSPYLRCVQTAIALSSGISQAGGASGSDNQILSSPSSPVPTMSPTSEERESASVSLSSSTIVNRRTLLRLDAFLGEWLTPDYFEHITPPPGSSTMLASAKGELLRRGETVDMNTPMRKPSLGHFPGGWNHRSSSGSTTPVTTELQQGQDSPPYAEKDEEGAHTSSSSHYPQLFKHNRYVPPMPNFAISPSDPIPPGYVAHARDACAEVDYQWDSLKAPLDWGTGGEYGEEWSSMHRRFRTGLQRMLHWYSQSDEGNNIRNADDDDDDDDDVETVVVLVTHGAGCNALIGALTKRPALIDVGLASLTVAVRKEKRTNVGAENISPPYKTSPADGTAAADIIDDYEMRLIASSDHLRRHRSNTQQQSFQPSRESSPRRPSINPTSSYRRRLDSAPAPLTPGEGDTLVRNPNAKKPQSQPPPQQQQQQRMPYSAVSRSMSVNTRSSSSPGLWGSSPVSTPDSVDDILPHFEDPRPPYTPSRRNTATPSAILDHVTEDTFPSGVTRTATLPTREKSTDRVRSQHGLWRSSSSSRDRESAFTERRWTMTDQAAS